MDQALQRELFDLVKVVLERLSSTPVVALVFILLFRKPIAVLIGSVSEPLSRIAESLVSRGFKVAVNKQGVQLEADAAKAASAQEQLPPSPSSGLVVPETHLTVESREASLPALEASPAADRLEQLMNVDVPPIVVEQRELIRKDLDSLNLPERQQISLLVKHLAITQLGLRAEVTYRTIFGSQIALLKFLNTVVNATKNQLEGYYDSASKRFPKLYTTYSFDQYLLYLTSRGLVTSGSGPNQYAITVAGREFLKWMAASGLVETKSF